VLQYLAQLLDKKWAVLGMAVSDLERPLLGADVTCPPKFSPAKT
jgi:hypothetical protein